MYRVLTYQDLQSRGAPSYPKAISEFLPHDREDGPLHYFHRDIIGSNPYFKIKTNNILIERKLSVTVNGKAFPHRDNAEAPSVQVVSEFLDQAGSPTLKRALDRVYYQDILGSGVQSLMGPIESQLFNWGSQFNSQARVVADVSLNVLDEDGRVYVDVETSNISIIVKEQFRVEGSDRINLKDNIFKEIPGRVFSRYVLEEDRAYASHVAMDTGLLYRLMTTNEMELEDGDIAAARKEAKEVRDLELALVNSIYELRRFFKTIPKENTHDRQIVAVLYGHLRKQQIALLRSLRTDPKLVKTIIADVNYRINEPAHRRVFLRYPNGINVLAHILIACTGIGAVVMVGKGFYTLKTQKQFDPLLFKPEDEAYRGVRRTFHRLLVNGEIVKPCRADAVVNTEHSPRTVSSF